MFHEFHFGDQICDLDQVCVGVAAGEDDVGHVGFLGGEEFDDFVDVDVVVADRDVDFVEEDHFVGHIEDQFLGFGPSGLSHFGIAGFVLGFPGEAFAHGVERAFVSEFGQD